MMGTGKMHRKAPKEQSHGFTIVETMIVLAVTGVLFIGITGLVQGKRQNAEFQQAANALKTELEQYISEVESGHYPTGASFPCTAASGAPNFSGTAAEQGGKTDCIFLGRALQFNTSTDASAQTYTAYTIAGVKTTGGAAPTPVKTFEESNPRVVPANFSRETKTLRYGLRVVSIKNIETGSITNGAVAFVPAFQAKDDGVQGSAASDLLVVGTNPGIVTDTTLNTRLRESYTSGLNPRGGVEICVQSATTGNKTAVLTLGGASGTSTVLLSIKANTCD